MSKKLLIVEESLRDLKAHWFEYIKHISVAASQLGWNTKVACHIDTEDGIKETLDCIPVFRHARYLDTAKRKWPGEQYYGFILHSYRVFHTLKKVIKGNRFDYVFCPTVTVHHLLAWYFLLKFYPKDIKKLCLFFVTNPGVWNKETQSVTYPKSTKILGYLLSRFKKYIQSGKLVMGVETERAKSEFEEISGVKFQLFPHPVPFSLEKENKVGNKLHLACYGFARYEKGSDVLQKAIEIILKEREATNLEFTIQWTDTFKTPDGLLCEVSEFLKSSSKVTIIDRAMGSEEYQSWLKKTDVMLLPYRNSSYYARVSRVAVEATNMGIPCIYTKGGWLEEAISNYGAGIGIADESVNELVNAIMELSDNFEKFNKIGMTNKVRSIDYFKPSNFCYRLLKDV